MLKNVSLKIILTLSLVSLGACNKNDGLLDGIWVSSKSRTLEEISKTMNLSKRHLSIVGNLVGKMKHTIKEDSWISEYNGVISEAQFKVLSKTDNCYELLIDNSKKIIACLIGEELHLPSGVANVLEVFVRV